MKKIFLPFALLITGAAFAQDSLKTAPPDTFSVTVHKDPRLLVLASKQEPYIAPGIHAAKGYRLMVLSTTDRQQAINLRSGLLQHFPDQKVYMSFQPPYVKVKFGNFLEKGEADKFRTEIKKAGLVKTNVYLVPETIEVKAERLKEFYDKDSN